MNKNNIQIIIIYKFKKKLNQVKGIYYILAMCITYIFQIQISAGSIFHWCERMQFVVKVNGSILRLEIFPPHDFAEIKNQLAIRLEFVKFSFVFHSNVIGSFRVVRCWTKIEIDDFFNMLVNGRCLES